MGKELDVNIDYKQRRKDFFRLNRFEIDDRFVIRDGKKHKCAIICPGGGYYMVCSFVEGVPFAKKLNEAGISALIVYYRVKRKAAFPNPQDDLAKAIKLIHEKKDEYNLDMDGYSIWGSSAGGHLVGSFGTASMGYAKYGLPKPGLLVLVYPVISLEKDITHDGTRANHIGKKSTSETEKKHSVHINVDKDYPTTFIWCGDSDNTVPPENTRLMNEALERNEIRHIQRTSPNVDHGVGLGIGTAAEGWIDEAITFWKSL